MATNANNGRHGRHASSGSYAQDQQAARDAYNAAASAYNQANAPRDTVRIPRGPEAQGYTYYADYAYDNPAAQNAYAQGRANQGRTTTLPGTANWGAAMTKSGKRKGRVPGPLKFILFLLLAIVLALGAYVFYLNHIMSLGDKLDDTRSALTSTAPGQPFYMLVVGTDSRDSTGETAGLTDVILLVRIDALGKVITAVSVPRDTPWVGSDGQVHKINSAYMREGPRGIIEGVQNLTGVKISHFAEVNFGGFGKLVDALGGIDVDVPITVGYGDAYTDEYVEVQAGHQHLNGQQATILCRARHEYGDYQEVSRQATVRLVTQAILASLAHVPLQNLPATVTTAAECVDTDMGVLEMMALAPLMRGGVTYYSATGPHEGGFNDYYGGQYFCYLDPTGWSNLMAVVDAGGDPSTVSFEGDPLSEVGAPQ